MRSTHATAAIAWLCGSLLACAGGSGQSDGTRPVGQISLASDHEGLVAGFAWARETALGYVRAGDPVGEWYEAALPGRDAFCMRDVSHQAEGALALGLYGHTANMMRKFAASVADSRDWCGYWEIDRLDRPAPVDYRTDEDFWYNLPANFDVLQASERAWQWTGDSTWQRDPQLREFYRRTLGDYVARWDGNGDGIVDSPEAAGIRGIPTYWEGDGRRVATGADLLAAQYAANRAYGRLLRARGLPRDSVLSWGFDAEADRLRQIYNEEWWNGDLGRFHSALLRDGSFDDSPIPAMQIFPLYFGIVDPDRAEVLLDGLEPGLNVEENSYLAEAYYLYGRDAEGFTFLMDQMDVRLARREYPENPFTAVSGVVRWLAGIRPLASEGVVETRSRLPAQVGWVELSGVPVLDGSLGLRHEGLGSTRLTKESGTWRLWRAVFAGRRDTLYVDGEAVAARSRPASGGIESFVTVELGATGSHRVGIARP